MAVGSGAAEQQDAPTEPVIVGMSQVDPGEYFSPVVRAELRRERDERRTRYRSLWWFPLLVVLIAMSGSWVLLKADQLVAEKLIWPSRGAQFIEVGPIPDDPATTGRPMMIVVGGLNRKSGTGPAEALMPALSAGRTRVFSLVYGSGISDQDIMDKFDALMADMAPPQVSFFGSSMGGDVVLNLAAHAQSRRDIYRAQLLDAAVPFGPGLTFTGRTSDAGQDRTQSTAGSTGQSASASGGPAGQQLAVGAIVAELSAPANAQPIAPPGRAQDLTADGAASPPPPPTLGTIYLDCSPLDAADVRNSSRTSADALTTLTEALHTDGGVIARLTAEVIAQQSEWSTGRFPFVDIRRTELFYKIKQVWQDKISNTGISTALVKDQYGVIRRMEIDDVLAELPPGLRIVYFLPENRDDDRTIRVRHVEQRLRDLAADDRLDLRVVSIPGGHHASAESNRQVYLTAMAELGNGTD